MPTPDAPGAPPDPSAGAPSAGARGRLTPTGTLFFGGLAILLTLAHHVFYGPGYPGPSLTGVIYTIIAVSLTPVLFYTLTRPLGQAELRFVASYAAIFAATAPTFFAPSASRIGLVAAALFLLAAFLPSWIKRARLEEQMRQLDGTDPATLIRALSSPVPSIRFSARTRLIELGDDAVPALIAASRRAGPDAPKRREMLLELLVHLSRSTPEGLEPTGAMSTLAGLWRELLNNPDAEVQRHAVLGLGRLNDGSSLNALLELLRSEQQKGAPLGPGRDQLCDALFEALATMAGELQAGTGGSASIRTARELVAALLKFHLAIPGPQRFDSLARLGGMLVGAIAAALQEHTGSPTLRRELARLLSVLRTMTAVPILVDLCQDQTPEVRLAATEGFLELLPLPGDVPEPGQPELPETLKKQVLDACIRLSGDPEARVCAVALEALSRLRDPQALPILLDHLGAPPGPGVDGSLYARVAANLARGRDPLVLDPLLRLLDATDPVVVAGAARGLGWFKDPRVAPKLKLLLQQLDRGVALSAAIGLAHQGDDSGRSILQQALNQSGGAVSRLEMLEALATVPDAAFPELLEAGVAGPAPGWTRRERAWAVQRLIDLKTQESYGVLERLWNNVGLEEPVRAMLQARLMAAGLLSQEATGGGPTNQDSPD